ncbi:hypothetical protein [Wielerella bovis]|uniref:hypothetical protein n=1 Tax=Wielerella bovis TaxID=2917790 RepID=UPI00201874CA|nr:hypothetical protein [Wielerella bovis]ULJ63859.1 hypothetical protein MIS33_06695 [Wielerella bovis]ULJ65974.1 hypothetical protein MIS31_06740 [Wielerella bovis]
MEDKATQRTLIDYFLTHLADKIHEPYLFGFALYLKSTHYHDEERINLLNAAIPLFIQAQGDEQHGLYAQAYLLYAYYDSHQYEQALRVAQNIPPNAFASHQQAWRDLVNMQLEICCLIKLNQIDNLALKLYDFFIAFNQVEETDVIMPNELAETIQSLVSAQTFQAA